MSTEATTMLPRPARSGVGAAGSGWWKQRPLLPRMQPVQNVGGYGHPGKPTCGPVAGHQGLCSEEQGAQLTWTLF